MFEDEIKKLEKSASFETEEMYNEFEKALESIMHYNDPKCIPVLLRFLDDNSPDPTMLYQIIHCVESFPSPTYYEYLFHSLRDVYKKAPEFLRILVYGILNSEKDLPLFKEALIQKKPKMMKDVLVSISNDSPKHRKICSELLLLT